MSLEVKSGQNKSPVVLHVALGPRSETPLFVNLLSGLKDKGFKQVVCFLTGEESEKSSFPGMGLEVVYLGFKKKDLKKIRLSAINKIKKTIIDRKVDIVHPQRHKPTLYGTFAALLAGPHVKVITTVHGRNRTRNLKRKLINKVMFKKIDFIIGVSQSVCSDIIKTNRGVSVKKVRCIYNGIDTKKFSESKIARHVVRSNLGIQDDAVLIGTVGRLTPVKGHRFLIEAFSRLNEQFENLSLVIWGEGDERESLENLIAEFKCGDQIKLPGFSEDIPSSLYALDIFVMSSLSEGHPLALLEAMAAGLPIVATSVGGIPEIITNKKEGVLVSPQDTEQLVDGLSEQLIKSSKERDEFGKSLQWKVKELYSIGIMVDKTADCYQQMLRQRA